MPGDFPDELKGVFAMVLDFTTGDIIACGHMDVRFIEHTDPLRVMRERFVGQFTPDAPEDRQALESSMVSGYAVGSAAHKIHVDHEGRTWALTVKLEAGEEVFPFTGRQEPKVVGWA